MSGPKTTKAVGGEGEKEKRVSRSPQAGQDIAETVYYYEERNGAERSLRPHWAASKRASKCCKRRGENTHSMGAVRPWDLLLSNPAKKSLLPGAPSARQPSVGNPDAADVGRRSSFDRAEDRFSNGLINFSGSLSPAHW